MAEEKKEVTVRNKSDAVHTYTDVVAGEVTLKPGEAKTFKVSQAGAEELEERSDNESDAFESVTKAEANKLAKAKADADAEAVKLRADAESAEAKAAAIEAGKDPKELDKPKVTRK